MWQEVILAMTNFTPSVNFSNIYSMFSINRGGLGTFFVDHIRWETSAGAPNYAPTVLTCDDKMFYFPQSTVTVSAVVRIKIACGKHQRSSPSTMPVRPYR